MKYQKKQLMKHIDITTVSRVLFFSVENKMQKQNIFFSFEKISLFPLSTSQNKMLIK